MIYSAIPAAQTLVAIFKAKGIQHIIISPGSRNAPLTIGFTEDPYFKCYSIVDERCGAFFALGLAIEQQQPTAVLCTSGSALLNYYPAVAEAFYSRIPLVVVSADRPAYKIDIGDGQTIRQQHVFEQHIGFNANLKLDVSHAQKSISKYQPQLLEENQEVVQQYNESAISRAVEKAVLEELPVHINIPFEEPLYDKVNELSVTVDQKTTKKADPAEISNLSDLHQIWEGTNRKMILIGVHPPNKFEQQILDMLGTDPSVIVFTETTSNLHHPNFFNSIDSIIAPIEKSEKKEEQFRALQPDILITFGGLIVSKKIKAFLREYAPQQHWHIDQNQAFDTFFSLSKHIKTEANYFFEQLFKTGTKQSSTYFKHWYAIKKDYQTKRTEYLQQIPFSDFKVFDEVIQTIPHTYQVHLANSSTVRYTQLFEMHASLKVYCNRGTSGIDGSTSTAIGASIHHKQPTLLITGDLSFLYDSNALWNSLIRKDFRVIVVNNGGGGIFKILPGNENTNNFSTYFETQHRHTAKHLCKMYGFNYYQASNGLELHQCLKIFYQPSNNPCLLEVFTPSKVNNNILLDYFDFIS